MTQAEQSASANPRFEDGGGCPECDAPLLHAQGCLACGSCGYSRCG